MFLLALVWFIAVVVFFFLNEWFQCWEMIDNNKKNSIKPKQQQKKSAQPWPWLVRGVFPTRSVVVFNMSPGRSDSQNIQPENRLFSPLTPPKKKDHHQGRKKKEALNLIEPQADKMSKNLPLNGSFPYCLLHRGLSSLIGCARASEVMTHS